MKTSHDEVFLDSLTNNNDYFDILFAEGTVYLTEHTLI